MLEIKDWKNVFYLAEAWKHAEVWWTKFPVARASVSYRRLMATREGHTAFCVFIGLLRMVQRGKTGGLLAVKGKPITAIDVAAETGISVKWCQAGMKMLESEEIGWLVPHVAGRAQTEGVTTAEDRPMDGGAPADGRRADGVTPSKRREEKRREENNSSSSIPVEVRGPVRHAGGVAAAAAGSAKGREEQDGTEGEDGPAVNVERLDAWLDASLVEKRAAAIVKRPEWLPEKFGWIEMGTAKRLAALPFTTRQWHDVMREAKRSRNTLENPAGFVIRGLEKALGAGSPEPRKAEDKNPPRRADTTLPPEARGEIEEKAAQAGSLCHGVSVGGAA